MQNVSIADLFITHSFCSILKSHPSSHPYSLSGLSHLNRNNFIFASRKKGKYVKVSAATALVPSAGGGGELSPAAVPPAPVGAPRVAQIMR